LPNYLDTEKPSLWWNGEILLDRRPGRGPCELSEDYVQTRRQLSFANSKIEFPGLWSKPQSDRRVKTMRA